MIEHANVSLCFDNEALYTRCTENLKIEKPRFYQMNNLVAQHLSTATSSLRFDGALNVTLGEFEANLVPYSRVSACLTSFAPLQGKDDGRQTPSVAEISNGIFSPENFLMNCNPNLGKYMACCLMYRGDVVPKDVGASIATLKTKRLIQFVDWMPTGFKCGICYHPTKFT
eukprot:CAMPEP_0170542548 /NCGR_PEP_ID=MMETSP0211-20121228/1941_1 /TAXON_ID=311385 /ORGANISM="Pseudokeronopsis sp., Strain OXSARD2" /LENGTH=169 /DNA_ID=CAMNT_0010845645 /DNA_START=568 /DNA_END=1077 /DNA_ORIENTATION=+